MAIPDLLVRWVEGDGKDVEAPISSLLLDVYQPCRDATFKGILTKVRPPGPTFRHLKLELSSIRILLGDRQVKIAGHPVHPMLIVFPLGLLATAVIFDIITLSTSNGMWSSMSWYMIGAGIIGGLLAAVFGLIDWIGIPSATRAKAVGLWHGVMNVVVVVLFAGSWLLRRPEPTSPSGLALALSFGAVVIAIVAGWLGGELVDRLGVGVDDGANLDAPSSLSVKELKSSRAPIRRAS